MSRYVKSGSQVDRPLVLGTGYFQDKSLELFRNVQEFVAKHVDEDRNPSRVFVARVALRPTLILASNPLVRSYLTSTSDAFYNGLQDFFFGLFGHSIMFAQAEEAAHLRGILMPLLGEATFADYDAQLSECLDHWLGHTLQLKEPENMYRAFKHLSLAYNLRVFLGVDEAQDPEGFAEIVEMVHTHWHGIISVPLNVKLSFLMSSTYRQAVEAKQRLLDLIEARLRDGRSALLTRAEQTMEPELIKNHWLIFICALIPKASASILTSLLDTSEVWYPKYVSESGQVSEEHLELVLLEVIRLWPPFVGSLRVARHDAEIGDYRVPQGHGVFSVTLMAHRDPMVFPYPEEFLPERWRTFNRLDRDKLFGFGAGPHACVGESYMWNFFFRVAQTFIREFRWDTTGLNGKHRKIKYLPVSRPAQVVPLKLVKRCPEAERPSSD